MASEFYGNGSELPKIHPDPLINANLLIEELCDKLDAARLALGHANQMIVITPAAVAMKNKIAWALLETDPKTIGEQHPNCG